MLAEKLTALMPREKIDEREEKREKYEGREEKREGRHTAERIKKGSKRGKQIPWRLRVGRRGRKRAKGFNGDSEILSSGKLERPVGISPICKRSGKVGEGGQEARRQPNGVSFEQ